MVKAFNNIYFEHLAQLARPSGAPDRSTLAIAGDDAEAKATATRVIDEIGYDTYDLGPLAEGWRDAARHRRLRRRRTWRTRRTGPRDPRRPTRGPARRARVAVGALPRHVSPS